MCLIKIIEEYLPGRASHPPEYSTLARQVQTELTPGTDKYTLHIYYGKTIEPTTFTAELNNNDLTSQFSPAPFTDQEVELSLQPGRNVLVLSIAGTRKDGKKAKDSDRLVFIVP